MMEVSERRGIPPEKLKQMLLGFQDFSRGFILKTDASFNDLGAILSQQQEGGIVVLGYASKALKPCERNMKELV